MKGGFLLKVVLTMPKLAALTSYAAGGTRRQRMRRVLQASCAAVKDAFYEVDPRLLMFPDLEGIKPGEKTYHETRRCCCCSFLQDLSRQLCAGGGGG